MDHAQHGLHWLSTENFMPHGHCYLWTPELLWTFVISESIIVLSYFSIPFALLYFVRKRTDLQFNWMFKLFSLFIFACGTTHLLGIWTIWHPDYWLDAAVNAATAIVSLIAAVLIWPLIPRALKVPSATQLEEAVSRLQKEAKQRLEIEAELLSLKKISDARFQVIFDQASLGIGEVDCETGKFLMVNQRYCDLLGYSREEMQGLDFLSITYPEDVAISRDKSRALKEGRIAEYSIDKRYLHKNGHLIWVTLTVSLLHKPHQSPTYLATVLDISKRKKAELELKEQLDELKRWHAVTLDRETRIQELKQEVNQLLQAQGHAARYAGAESPQ